MQIDLTEKEFRQTAGHGLYRQLDSQFHPRL